MTLRLPHNYEVALKAAKREFTDNDYRVARSLLATERFGDATRESASIPPLYIMLAFHLKDPTNREIVRDLLEDK